MNALKHVDLKISETHFFKHDTSFIREVTKEVQKEKQAWKEKKQLRKTIYKGVPILRKCKSDVPNQILHQTNVLSIMKDTPIHSSAHIIFRVLKFYGTNFQTTTTSWKVNYNQSCSMCIKYFFWASWPNTLNYCQTTYNQERANFDRIFFYPWSAFIHFIKPLNKNVATFISLSSRFHYCNEGHIQYIQYKHSFGDLKRHTLKNPCKIHSKL